MKNKKQRNSLLLVILLLTVTIGYAVLTTNLKITGTANIKSNTWDVHFENIANQTGVTPTVAPVTDNTTTTELEFTVDLDLPGDFYEFNVDAVNDGSIDAMVSLVTTEFYTVTEENEQVVETPTEKPNYINYTVTYEDGSEILENHLLEKNGGTETYKVRIEYDKNQVASSDVSLKCKITPTYIQADDDAQSRGRLNELSTGDLVYFDPVNYRMCDDDKTGATCYTWNVFEKSGNTYDLYYTVQDSNMKWNVSTPYVSLQNIVSTWSDKLKTIPSTYDLPQYNMIFSTEKARLVTQDDVDTYGSMIICDNNQPCIYIDPANDYVKGKVNTQTFNMMTLSSLTDNTTPSNMYIHPIVHIDMTTVGNNRLAPKSAYEPGDVVFFDPVTKTKCDGSTYNLTKINNNQSTCYRWRVLSTDDTASKKQIKLQLDHNLVNLTGWNTDYSHNGIYELGPRDVLTNLATATATWTRVPLLNYEYDTSDYAKNYGKLTCVNGNCTVPGGDVATNVRARIITGEEIKELTLWAGADSSSAAYAWSPTTQPEFAFSSETKGLGYPPSSTYSQKASTELSWLIENTYVADSDSHSTNNVYGETNNGYWTLTPSPYDRGSLKADLWYVSNLGAIYTNGYMYLETYYGARPIIVTQKSYLRR